MRSVEGQKRKRTRILIVDDHPLVRDCLKMLIETEADLKVCGEAADRAGALELVKSARPELVLLDLTLHDSHGLDLLKEIHAQHPELAVLIVSMHDESLYAERALRAGARGYINKQEASHKVLQAIRTVLAGKIYLSESQFGAMTAKVAGRSRTRLTLGVDSLTDRELRVFELLGQGLSTRHISDQLRLDMRTIETYRARIKQKLQLHNATQLLQHAIRWVESGGVRERPSASHRL